MPLSAGHTISREEPTKSPPHAAHHHHHHTPSTTTTTTMTFLTYAGDDDDRDDDDDGIIVMPLDLSTCDRHDRRQGFVHAQPRLPYRPQHGALANADSAASGGARRRFFFGFRPAGRRPTPEWRWLLLR